MAVCRDSNSCHHPMPGAASGREADDAVARPIADDEPELEVGSSESIADISSKYPHRKNASFNRCGGSARDAVVADAEVIHSALDSSRLIT